MTCLVFPKSSKVWAMANATVAQDFYYSDIIKYNSKGLNTERRRPKSFQLQRITDNHFRSKRVSWSTNCWFYITGQFTNKSNVSLRLRQWFTRIEHLPLNTHVSVGRKQVTKIMSMRRHIFKCIKKKNYGKKCLVVAMCL